MFEYFTNRFLRAIFSVGLVYEFIFTFILLTIITTAIFFNSNDDNDKDVTNELLLEKLGMNKNYNSDVKTILVEKIAKPQLPIYSYSFSVYLKDMAVISGYPERKYLFERKDDKCPTTNLTFDYKNDATKNTHGRNIGLRMGNTNSGGKNDLSTLYLDYATEKSGITNFYTTPIVTEFPTKKWINIVLTVDKNIINLYVDGVKLTKQLQNINLKAPSATRPIEFGYMDAHLANLYHSTSVVTPTPSFIARLSKVDEINL